MNLKELIQSSRHILELESTVDFGAAETETIDRAKENISNDIEVSPSFVLFMAF